MNRFVAAVVAVGAFGATGAPAVAGMTYLTQSRTVSATIWDLRPTDPLEEAVDLVQAPDFALFDATASVVAGPDLDGTGGFADASQRSALTDAGIDVRGQLGPGGTFSPHDRFDQNSFLHVTFAIDQPQTFDLTTDFRVQPAFFAGSGWQAAVRLEEAGGETVAEFDPEQNAFALDGETGRLIAADATSGVLEPGEYSLFFRAATFMNTGDATHRYDVALTLGETSNPNPNPTPIPLPPGVWAGLSGMAVMAGCLRLRRGWRGWVGSV